MTTNRDAVTVLADTIGRTHNTYGPRIYEIAEEQIAALEHAGYVIVRRFDLSRIASFLNRAHLHGLETMRAASLLAALRHYLPPSEDDDDAPPNTHDGPGGKW